MMVVFFLTGEFKFTLSPVPFSMGIRIDSNLTPVWETTVEKIYKENAYGTSVAQTPNGAVMISSVTGDLNHIMFADLESGAPVGAEMTLFDTYGHYHNDLIRTNNNTFALATTRATGPSTDINFIEFEVSADHNSINKAYDISLGEPGINEEGYQIIQSRDGGFIILGIAQQSPVEIVLQKINPDRTRGWREPYSGATTEYPGGIVQNQKENDFGFFSFTIAEGDGGNVLHVLKTDEVGKTADKLQ
jgi:hypothetical protein